MTEADSVHSTPPTNTSATQADNPSLEALDLAQLRFVRCLFRYGATAEEAGAVVAAELKRLQTVARKQRRTLIGNRLVPVEARQ